jgi:hypothetical protein
MNSGHIKGALLKYIVRQILINYRFTNVIATEKWLNKSYKELHNAT